MMFAACRRFHNRSPVCHRSNSNGTGEKAIDGLVVDYHVNLPEMEVIELAMLRPTLH